MLTVGFGRLYALVATEVGNMTMQKKSIKKAAGKRGAKLSAPAGRKMTNMKVSMTPMSITKKIDKSTPF